MLNQKIVVEEVELKGKNKSENCTPIEINDLNHKQLLRIGAVSLLKLKS